MWQRVTNYAQRREVVRLVSDRIHVPPAIVFIAMLMVLLIMILRGIGSYYMVLFLLFVYPAYMTFKSLKGGKPELLLRFGKYWVVLGFTAFVYSFTGWLLKMLPFYGILKCTAAYVVVRGDAAGAVSLYDNVVLPLMSQYESFIDSKLEALQKGVEESQRDLSEFSGKAPSPKEGQKATAAGGTSPKDKTQ